MHAKKMLFIGAMALVFLGFGLLVSDKPSGDALGPAPEIRLNSTDGTPFVLSEKIGNEAVVLAFFTTWCGFCTQEIPELNRLQTEVGQRAVRVVGVNLQEPPELVQPYMDKNGVQYPVLLDPEGVAGMAYGVRGIPHIVGVDRGGQMRFVGHALPRDHEAFIRLLVGENEEVEK